MQAAQGGTAGVGRPASDGDMPEYRMGSPDRHSAFVEVRLEGACLERGGRLLVGVFRVALYVAPARFALLAAGYFSASPEAAPDGILAPRP